MDRESRDSFELRDEIEKTPALDTAPISWTVGRDRDFMGAIELGALGGLPRLLAATGARRPAASKILDG
jgi:peptide chain release factor 3